MLARRKSDSAFTELSYASAADPRLKRLTRRLHDPPVPAAL
jgi:hypothetical protein